MGRCVDADPVHLFRAGGAHADGPGAQDRTVSPLAGDGGEALGVVERDTEGETGEEDGRGDNRTCQGAPAGLIDAGNQAPFKSLSALDPPIELAELLELRR